MKSIKPQEIERLVRGLLCTTVEAAIAALPHTQSAVIQQAITLEERSGAARPRLVNAFKLTLQTRGY